MVMQKHDEELKQLKEQVGRTTEEQAKTSGKIEMVLKSIHAQPPPVAAPDPVAAAGQQAAVDPAVAQMAPAPVPPSMPPPGVVQ